MHHHKTPSFIPLLKALADLDADMRDAAEHMGVDLPEYDAPEGMDAIVAAFQELEVDAAAQRCNQILQQAGRDFVAGRLPAMAFMEIERRVQAASEAINRRAARLAPFGGN